MKFKPATVILVAIALLLGGVVYFTQLQGASQTDLDQTGVQKIFAFEEKQVNALTLTTQLRSLAFQKNSDGVWQMTEPEQATANDASIAYLLNLLATATSETPLTVPAANQEDFGFHQPLATITVGLDNQATHRLIIGGYDFDRSFLYAQADPDSPPTDNLNILLISPNFDSAVNRSLDEWKERSRESSPIPEASPSP